MHKKFVAVFLHSPLHVSLKTSVQYLLPVVFFLLVGHLVSDKMLSKGKFFEHSFSHMPVQISGNGILENGGGGQLGAIQGLAAGDLTSSGQHGASPSSTNDLINQLKQNGLWDLTGKKEIPPLLVSAFPVNLHHLDVPSKKRAFFHALLPVAKVALLEVEEERQQLLAIMEKAGLDLHSSMSVNESGWQHILSGSERSFLLSLAKKYRSNQLGELVRRVDGIPASMILAQAAIESSWGTSRFALEGNNIFGMWTWGDKGMIPAKRDTGKSHKLAVYDSILDSVRDYLLTLNRHAAYKEMRDIRTQTIDSLNLAEGLLKYSERGEEYVSDVQMMIEFNQLRQYDELHLAGQAKDRLPIS